ncbi:MAG: IS66 family insertion sequence element accessory protein TnpB [Candidatus Riflebacteria bacterium]|nr:IS66 family insertion sequence element accessory protein TnpB [Candidatus Riflebacteria bacterium]
MQRVFSQLCLFLLCGVQHNRKEIDGLAGICRSQLKQDPTNGDLFIFIMKSGDWNLLPWK